MIGRKKLNLTENEKENRQKRRTLQNRINKRNQRIRIKMKENISSSLSKMGHEEEYISNLINYFNTYEFDIHFTGTYDPKYSKKISLQSLKSYADKFIQLLIDEGIIEYGLIFLDTGENENTHTHILIKTNSNIKKNHNLIKSKWLLGTNVCSKIIETENHKLNTIKYGFNKTRGNTHSTRKTLWNLIKK
jgi:uncharacterized protein YllA (UPF0747 family)